MSLTYKKMWSRSSSGLRRDGGTVEQHPKTPIKIEIKFKVVVLKKFLCQYVFGLQQNLKPVAHSFSEELAEQCTRNNRQEKIYKKNSKNLSEFKRPDTGLINALRLQIGLHWLSTATSRQRRHFTLYLGRAKVKTILNKEQQNKS